MCRNAGGSGGSSRGGSKGSAYSVTTTSYLENLADGRGKLTPEQIYEINQQRRAFMREKEQYLYEIPERDRPQLNDTLTWKYYDIVDEKAVNLSRLSDSSLKKLKQQAEYDLRESAGRLSRIEGHGDVQLDAGTLTYSKSRTMGENWKEQVDEIARRERTLQTINTAIKQKTDRAVKRFMKQRQGK